MSIERVPVAAAVAAEGGEKLCVVVVVVVVLKSLSVVLSLPWVVPRSRVYLCRDVSFSSPTAPSPSVCQLGELLPAKPPPERRENLLK